MRKAGDMSGLGRTQNVSQDEHCRYCCGTGVKSGMGWVFVGWSGVGTEQLAPCPFCEAGFAVEFPEGGKGPWGADGFWQGRSTAGVEPTCECDVERVPGTPEQIERLRIAMGAAGE